MFKPTHNGSIAILACITITIYAMAVEYLINNDLVWVLYTISTIIVVPAAIISILRIVNSMK